MFNSKKVTHHSLRRGTVCTNSKDSLSYSVSSIARTSTNFDSAPYTLVVQNQAHYRDENSFPDNVAFDRHYGTFDQLMSDVRLLSSSLHYHLKSRCCCHARVCHHKN